VLVGAVLVTVMTACGGGDVGVPAGSASDASGNANVSTTSGTTDLIGTWRTGPIPVERVRAEYQRGGGTPAQALDFVSQYSAGTVRYELRITDTGWEEYEIDGEAVPAKGSGARYTVEGAAIHTYDERDGCRQDLTFSLTGSRLVLRSTAQAADCIPTDLQAVRAIYQSAPFIRVP
jgi:hypothetical protein